MGKKRQTLSPTGETELRGEARIIHGSFGRAAVLWPVNALVAHAHRDAHIIVPIEGEHTPFEVDGESYVLEPGVGMLVNPFEVHGSPTAEDRPAFLAFYINPEWLHRHFALPQAKPFDRRSFPIDAELQATTRGLIEMIMSGAALEDMLGIEIELLLSRLVMLAMPATDVLAPPRSRSDYRVRRAIRFMQENLDVRVSLEEVARNVGLSRPHFFSLFHEQTGMTPRLYWNVLRLEHAIGQIGSREPLGSLAFNLGFSSQGNFSRFFRDHTGVSPLRYRQSIMPCDALSTAA